MSLPDWDEYRRLINASRPSYNPCRLTDEASIEVGKAEADERLRRAFNAHHNSQKPTAAFIFAGLSLACVFNPFKGSLIAVLVLGGMAIWFYLGGRKQSDELDAARREVQAWGLVKDRLWDAKAKGRK